MVYRFLTWVFTLILFFSTFAFANAVTCEPPFNGVWNVTGNCTYPTTGIKVYGDINVGNATITVPTGAVLWINLGTNKVTFSSGKILFQWSWKMDNSVSSRNFITISYSASSSRTNCPSGYRIVNTAWNNYQWSTVTSVAASGTIRCWKI